jgi:hypothetical protein
VTVPYSLPASMPAPGAGGWNVPLQANLDDLAARLVAHEAAYGIPLDGFAGSSDDAKLAAAMAYAKAQTRPPAILLADRAHSFSGGPYQMYNGMRLIGSLGWAAREFASTGPECTATIGGTAFLSVPSGGVANVWVSGIQFRAASGSVNWMTPVTDPSAGPIITDGVFERLAWVGFARVMQARHLRCRIDYTYTNQGTDTQFELAGSDNSYWVSGYSFLSSTLMTAAQYYIRFNHMSRTRMGAVYITPQVATGIRIDGSYGDLQIDGTLLDSTGRTATTACQGSAVLITAGAGITLRGCWFFNNAVNPSSTGRNPVDKGQVMVRGTASEILLDSCNFGGFNAQTGYTPSTTPAVYASTGATAVKLCNLIASNGGTKLVQHQSSGIITKYGMDDWTLAVA